MIVRCFQEFTVGGIYENLKFTNEDGKIIFLKIFQIKKIVHRNDWLQYYKLNMDQFIDYKPHYYYEIEDSK